jgi:SAM-dependent methyltransferase
LKLPFFRRHLSNPIFYPILTHVNYYLLTQLKQVLEYVISNYLIKLNQITLLDFGCGNKPYQELFKPLDLHYIGADIALNPVADVIIDTVTGSVQLEDGSIDVVLSTQVLEHVESPSSYLAEAFRVCRKEGLLILTTHGYWIYHPTPQDYWRWTSSGLTKVVEQAGFEIVERKGIMGLASTGLQLFQDAFINNLPKLVKLPLVVVMQSLILVADKLQPAEDKIKDASVFLIVARKP